MKFLFLAFFILSAAALAQDESFSEGVHYYIGGEAGLSFLKIEDSQYLLMAGCRINRHSGNSFITFSYSFINPISFGVNNEKNNNDNSRFGRFNLMYGYIIPQSFPHRFFSLLRIGLSGGISFNSIKYFKTYPDLQKNKLSTLNKVGVVLSLSKYIIYSEDIYAQFQISTNIINQYYRPVEYTAGLHFRLP